MPTNIWQINDLTFAARGLSNVKLQRITQSPDLLTFTEAVDYDADAAFADGETITVKRDGAQWFVGRCTSIARRGNSSGETIKYTISGPWWQLANVIYEQEYLRETNTDSEIEDASYSLARIILASTVDGEQVDAGAVITAAVDYALTKIGSGAIFQIGVVDVDTPIPMEEVKSLSCAEIISRVLRWAPDVVAYFDYATSAPTLNFRKRANLSSITYAIDDLIITDNAINPRNDLQKNGVIVTYERSNNYDGTVYTEILTDTAGVTGDPFKTLSIYLDLVGQSVALTKQTIEVETIQPTSAAWWSRQLPQLAHATNISVVDGTRTPVDDGETGWDKNDGSDYSSKLISGSVAEWMSRGVCDQIVTGTVTYTADGETKTEELKIKVVGTNATSKTYTTVNSSTAAEEPPDGLAASILSSLSTLHYEGSLTLIQSEAGADTIIDRKLNISGGRSDWTSMDAQIYSVSYDLDTGTTQIQFGPAQHLGANDLYQLTRNVRTRTAATSSTRTGGQSAQVSLPTKGPSTVTAGGSSSGGSTHPYQITWDATAATISVLGGLLFSSSIDTSPISVTAVTGVAGAASSDNYIWLEIDSTDGYTVDTAQIQTGTAWPTLIGTSLPYTLNIPLGQIVSDAVQQYRRDHIYLALANTSAGITLIPR
jgi:hypothetical protein